MSSIHTPLLDVKLVVNMTLISCLKRESAFLKIGLRKEKTRAHSCFSQTALNLKCASEHAWFTQQNSDTGCAAQADLWLWFSVDSFVCSF